MDDKTRKDADVISFSDSLPSKELDEQPEIKDEAQVNTIPNNKVDDTISEISIPRWVFDEVFEEPSEIFVRVAGNASKDPSYWNIMYIFVILVGCTIETSIVTMIPRHNTILYPEFWYEPMILVVLTVFLRLAVATIMELFIFSNVQELLTPKVFLKLFLAYSLPFVLLYCLCYFTWSVWLGRNHPLPYIGACGYVVYPVFFISVWYLFPPNMRPFKQATVFFIAIELFHLSESTIYCIFGVELALHMRACYQIVNLNRKIVQEPTDTKKETFAQEKKKRVFELAVKELVETMCPLVYGIGYATAYYGPNGNLIRNIRSNYFGGKVMNDIQHFYFLMFELLVIDLIAMILSAGCLYHFCRINLFQEFCFVLKSYWWMMMIQLSLIAGQIGFNDINFALDFTGRHLWTSDEGRHHLINNTCDISDEERSMLLLNYTLIEIQ